MNKRFFGISVAVKEAKGPKLWLYTTVNHVVALSMNPEHANQFETKLAGEEYLLNFKFANSGHETFKAYEWTVEPYEIEMGY